MRTAHSLTISRCIPCMPPPPPPPCSPQQPCMAPRNHACPLQPHMSPTTMHAPLQPHMPPPTTTHTHTPATTHPPPLQPCTLPTTMHAPHNHACPPVNRMTDRCKNITLPQTSFAGGNNRICLRMESKRLINSPKSMFLSLSLHSV